MLKEKQKFRDSAAASGSKKQKQEKRGGKQQTYVLNVKQKIVLVMYYYIEQAGADGTLDISFQKKSSLYQCFYVTMFTAHYMPG